MTSIALRRLGSAAAGCLAVFAFVTAEVSAGQQAPSAKDWSTVIEMLRSPDAFSYSVLIVVEGIRAH